MLSYKEKIEDILRFSSWYLDYYLFSLKNIFNWKRLRNVESIIIIDLKYIGDLIIDTPMIRALKQEYPGAKISILVPESMKDVLRGNSNIHEIITNDLNSIKKLSKEKYDLGVLLYPGNKRTSSFLKKIARYRIGVRRPGAFDKKGYYLDKKTKPCLSWKHKIDDNLDVIKTIGIETDDKKLGLYATKRIDSFFRKNRISKKDFLVVIHAAPQHKSHEWIQDRFALLADKLIEDYKAKIVFTGAIKDLEYNEEIIDMMNHDAINYAGNSIQDFFAMIKRSDLVISVDTAAIHVAAGFDKKVIALFGAGNPRVWHPYCDNFKIIYKQEIAHTRCWKHNCYLKGDRHMECMKAIQIYDLLKAVEELVES
jgi:ADP-heptose:LPS heptosyltransferase|tara:strand:+ start:322 stop:1422 length:1101 start_codon:yes stop_codon:yes gene_type:complete